MAEKRTSNALNHTIQANKVKAGDHIYIHTHGGLRNKHGIVIPDEGEGLKVVHYEKQRLKKLMIIQQQ